MWKVMLKAILIWCLCAVEAFYDGNTDYWYSNDDGMIFDSLTPVSHFRSHNDNETNILRSHNDFVPGKIRKSNPSKKIYPERNRTHLRTFNTPPFKNPVLLKLEKKRTPEETWSCSDGPSKTFDCNNCVCMGGQLYLCTAKRCSHFDASGMLVLKSYRERLTDECVEGEHIQSFDCNRCWCSGGKIICTKNRCGGRKPALQKSPKDERCVPGENLRSPDGCNTCGCTKRGEKYCTARGCGIRPKQIKDRNVGCVPQTWYSLYGSSTCKECYCTDGKMAFCYMKLCAGERVRHRGYTPLKLMSALKTSTCNKGAVMYDECSKCICTYKEQWKCFTRLIDKCSGAGKETPKKTPRPKKPGHSKTTKDYKKIEETDKIITDYWKDLNKQDDKNETPNNHGDSKPGKNDDEEEDQLDNDGDEKEEGGKTTSSEIINDSINVDDTLTIFKFPRLPKKPPKRIVTTTEKYVKTTKKLVTTTTRPVTTTTEIRLPDLDNFDIELPSICNKGELFTQGYDSNCQGCFCTSEGQWNCFSLAGPCREWKKCWVGVYEKNTQVPCSVCYCGADEKFMCAVDEHCSQEIKPSLCEALDCEKSCHLKQQRHGFCHQDKCICV